MGYHVVWIYTNEKSSKYRYGGTSLDINVESKTYDCLSNRFKKVTHSIQYTKNYSIFEYYFQIYNPNGGYYSKYIFKYKNPVYMLTAVEVFFKIDDGNNKVPLILGFNQNLNQPVYFTYKYLCGLTNGWIAYYEHTGYLPRGSFKEPDLLTMLLEELNTHLGTGREKRILMKLDPITDKFEDKYPLTGNNQNKITIKKSIYENNFYKYEHSIESKINTEYFYLSFEKDSLYIQRDSTYYNKTFELMGVYYFKYNDKTPVIIEFKLDGIYKQYKYSDFKSDLKNSHSVKKFSQIVDVENRILKAIVDAYDNENTKTTFLLDQKNSEYSSSVKVTTESVEAENYKMYKHSVANYLSINESNILLKGGQFYVADNQYKYKVKEVCTYFLKSKVGGKVDDTPFLIRIKTDIDVIEYYTKVTDENQSWTKLKISNEEELISKIREIQPEENGNQENFKQGRQKAFQALNACEFLEQVPEYPHGQSHLSQISTSQNGSQNVYQKRSFQAKNKNVTVLYPARIYSIPESNDQKLLQTLGCVLGGLLSLNCMGFGGYFLFKKYYGGKQLF